MLRDRLSFRRSKCLYNISSYRRNKLFLVRDLLVGHILSCFTIDRLNFLPFCIEQENLHNVRIIVNLGQHRRLAANAIKHIIKVVAVFIHRAKRIIAILTGKLVILLTNLLPHPLVDFIIDLRNSRGIAVPRKYPVRRAPLRVNGVFAENNRNITKLVVRNIRTSYSDRRHRKTSEL